MNIPNQLRYTKDHEWVRLEGEIAVVGITDFAQGELGDIVYVDITTLGDTVEANEVFGTVEAVKTVSDLFMPLTGEVLEVNTDLDASPEVINSDPYEKGWIIKIKVANTADFEALLDAQAYQSLIS